MDEEIISHSLNFYSLSQVKTKSLFWFTNYIHRWNLSVYKTKVFYQQQTLVSICWSCQFPQQQLPSHLQKLCIICTTMRLQMHFLVSHEVKREKHLSHGLIRLNDYVIPTYIIKKKIIYYIYIYRERERLCCSEFIGIFYCSELTAWLLHQQPFTVQIVRPKKTKKFCFWYR